jgi:hypothetical protein
MRLHGQFLKIRHPVAAPTCPLLPEQDVFR